MISFRMILAWVGIGIIVGCAPSSQQQQAASSPEVTTAEILQHIKYLASDELRGRKAGEEGNRLAAQYIANLFEQDGLKPIGDDGGYFQNFSFVSSTKEGKANQFTVALDGRTIEYKIDEQYKPLSFSIDTTLTTPLVFVGYGISSTDSLQYDDYAGVDVKGKNVIVLRYSPAAVGMDHLAERANLMVKVMTAREKGAAGIIFVTAPPDSAGAELSSFHAPVSAYSGVAAAAIRWSDVDSIFHLLGKDLRTIQHAIDSTKAPSSFGLPNTVATLQTQIIKVHAKTANVLGYIEGSDPILKNQLLVIGAHFDHLGMGGEGSLAPDTVAVHHGADDNASGTAGVLELAQYFAAHRQALKRSLLFIAFSGEELGLLGSDYYVKHPVLPLDSTVAMINMDMIGRMKDSALIVEGMGTSPQFERIVRSENSDSLKLTLKPDGYGPSDQASFYSKNLPVIFFFTNLHSDYHKPSDTWDKINYPGEQKVIQLAGRVATDIVNEHERPTFTKVAVTPGMAGGDRGNIRVSLGIIPDFGGEVAGMKIGGTRPGSAADKAGLKADDVIVRFGGKDVKNIYDFTYLLGQFKPGDVVDIEVKRGTETVMLKATLEARK
jgi:aminopeptidase YwaD